MKYYTKKNIDKTGAHYRMIFGKRSDGKTYAVIHDALKKYWETGEQLAVIRRWDDDFSGENSAKTMYDSLMCNGDGDNVVARITNNAFTGVEYYAGKYYLTVTENDKICRSGHVIALAFSLTRAEHYKSGSYPKVKTVLFDEFLTDRMYLPDEFITFQNLLSTIIRKRDDVTIYMCGNTIAKYNPYFTEMGLTRAKDMKPGDLDVYSYGETQLRVAVEFSDSPSKNAPSDVYFAFNNPKLAMITGQGEVWQMKMYPHCPCKYTPAQVIFTYFIIFDNQLLQCEIILKGTDSFTYIHRKTTPLQRPTVDLIYCLDPDIRPNWKRKLTQPEKAIEIRVAWYFKAGKVFYQDNEIGELVRAYLTACKQDTLTAK